MKPAASSRFGRQFSGTVLLALLAGGFPALGSAKSLPVSAEVVEVFDGDTVLLDNGKRVRYLGIDAPEVAHEGKSADCYGAEARSANAERVLHKRVTLRYDRETVDVHGRLLAYVMLADGTCVNAELLRAGCAVLFRTPEGLSRFEEFLAAQREAIRSFRGLYGACTVAPASAYRANRRSFVFHRPECEKAGQTSARNRLKFSTRWEALDRGFHPCRFCKP